MINSPLNLTPGIACTNVGYRLFKSHDHEGNYALIKISFTVSSNILATMASSSFF